MWSPALQNKSGRRFNDLLEAPNGAQYSFSSGRRAASNPNFDIAGLSSSRAMPMAPMALQRANLTGFDPSRSATTRAMGSPIFDDALQTKAMFRPTYTPSPAPVIQYIPQYVTPQPLSTVWYERPGTFEPLSNASRPQHQQHQHYHRQVPDNGPSSHCNCDACRSASRGHNRHDQYDHYDHHDHHRSTSTSTASVPPIAMKDIAVRGQTLRIRASYLAEHEKFEAALAKYADRRDADALPDRVVAHLVDFINAERYDNAELVDEVALHVLAAALGVRSLARHAMARLERWQLHFPRFLAAAAASSSHPSTAAPFAGRGGGHGRAGSAYGAGYRYPVEAVVDVITHVVLCDDADTSLKEWLVRQAKVNAPDNPFLVNRLRDTREWQEVVSDRPELERRLAELMGEDWTVPGLKKARWF